MYIDKLDDIFNQSNEKNQAAGNFVTRLKEAKLANNG